MLDSQALGVVTDAVIRGSEVHLLLSPSDGAAVGVGLRARVLRGDTEHDVDLWPAPQARLEPDRATIDLSELLDEGGGDGVLIKGLTPIGKLEDGAAVPAVYDDSYQLANLLPVGASETHRLIYHKKTRYHDVGVLLFVLEQIMRSPLNSAADKIEAAKILSFRAMENLDRPQLNKCLGHLDTALFASKSLHRAHGLGKETRYHAVVSCWYVKGCVLLLTGHVGKALRELDRLRPGIDQIEHSPTAANNCAIGIALAGYVRFCLGQTDEAIAAWEDVIRIFRLAAQYYPSVSPKIFNELAVAFDAAKFAADAINNVRRNARRDSSSFLNDNYVAQNYLRIRGSRGASEAEQLFGRLKRRLSE
ncbi:hypothetical protein [Hansschlegelia zhihuaiae]|uniref:Tetratricopeptide repeat protein n=1 Tax=Hansschlegelia zhihuaiae TaxID=405005 RepID=A0A4Q0M3F4_9HYPH|nr:hypothetical protein [Hansschlegelia zhihuaiae]RXF67199.1 hypothetical protein EK403_21575 [Hansschlegelia zhihuaiae]